MSNRNSTQNRLFIKIMAGAVVCLGAAMLFSLAFSIYSSGKALEQEVKRSVADSVEEKRNQLETAFVNLERIDINLASLPMLVDFVRNLNATGKADPATKRVLRDYLGKVYKGGNGLYENVFMNHGKDVVVDGMEGLSESYVFKETDPAFEMLRKKTPYFGDPAISPITGRYVMPLGAPIIDPQTGELLATMNTVIDLVKATHEVLTGSDTKTETFILDSNGLVMASGNENYVLKLKFSEEKGLQEFFRQTKQTKSGIGKFVLGEKEYTAAFTRVNTGNMLVVTGMPVAVYQSEIDALRNKLILIVAAFVIVGTMMLTFFIYLITKPLLGRLSQAMVAAEQIAAGDLSQPIGVTGSDEGTRLLQALSEMQASLRATVEKIMGTSRHLSRSADEMRLLTGEAEAGFQQQTRSLEQVVTAMSEMSAAFEDVSHNAREAANASQDGDQQSLLGRHSVEQSISAMDHLSHDLDGSSSKLVTLAEQVNKISSVLEVIRSIAEQTNLLALNAAIESARAGESGRGFAVVADEVRTLSHRTEDATKEISGIIAQIQEGTAQAVEAMQRSNGQSQQALAIARQAGDALVAITELMSRISNGNQNIAGATGQQVQTVREIDMNVISIRDIALQTAEGAKRNRETGTQLSQLAQELDSMVGRFRV